MAKLTLSDIGNLRPPAIGTINSNSASIETALENTLSRDGTSPNQMAAVLDMNSNRIINLPDAVSDQEPLTLGQYMGGSGAVGAPTNGSYLVVSSNATLINERVFTAGTGIALTDAGANSTLTVNLANTAATPGTYGSGGTVVPTITVDAQGRITAVSNTSITVGTYVAGSGLTLTGNSFSITSLGVTNAMLAGSITAAKLVGSDIATVGTLTAGATGAGFTVALSTSTITGTLGAARLPALTGDITTTIGTVATTLATVNANVGSFGSSTAIPTFTVNGKGLITAASTAAVIAPAGTLTGTTLAANVVTSSLTSVGTLIGGATGAGFTVALTTSTITGTLADARLPTSMATKTFTGTTTLSGPVLITDATASTTTGTGALIVSGGVGVAGSINAGNLATALTFKSTGTPAANATLTSTATVNVANGASSPLAIATGKGMIFITELSFSGDIGLYAVANGNATVLISPGGFFVNATTTPAAGHASIAYDGVSTMKIYNNSGVTSTFNVIQIVV